MGASRYVRLILAAALVLFPSIEPALAQSQGQAITVDVEPTGQCSTVQGRIVRGSNKTCTCNGVWVCTDGDTGTDPGGNVLEYQFHTAAGTFGGSTGMFFDPTNLETNSKFFNGQYALDQFKTGGTGKEGDCFTGWDTSDAINKAANCNKDDSTDLGLSCVVTLGPGCYWASDTRPFQNFTTPAGKVVGMTFVGAGKHNTVIRPNPSFAGDEFWFFDNCADPPNCFDHCSTTKTTQCRSGAIPSDCPGGETCVSGAIPTYHMPKFQGIGFEGAPICTGGDGGIHCVGGLTSNLYLSIPDDKYGFRIVASIINGSVDRYFTFEDIRLENLQGAVELWGSNTASEMTWTDCFFGKIRGRTYSIMRNGQSVNHNFYGTHAESYFGDLIYVEGSPTIPSTTGGGIFWHGGDIVASQNLTGSPTTMSYLFHGGPNTGSSVTGVVGFQGVMYEPRGPYNGLVKTDDGTGLWNITFDNVRTTVGYNDTADKEIARIGPATTVNYLGGTLRTQNVTNYCTNPRGVCALYPTVECGSNGDCASGTCTKGTHLCGNNIKFYADDRGKMEGRWYFRDTLVQENMETYIDWNTPEMYGRASCEGCKAGPGATIFRRTLNWIRGNVSTDNQGDTNSFDASFNSKAECMPTPVTQGKGGKCFASSGNSVATIGLLAGAQCALTPFAACDEDADCTGTGNYCACSADSECPGSNPYCESCGRFLTFPNWTAIDRIHGSFGSGCGTANTLRYCVGTVNKSETFGCTDYMPQSSGNAINIDMQGRPLGAQTTLRLWAEGGTGAYSVCAFNDEIKVGQR